MKTMTYFFNMMDDFDEKDEQAFKIPKTRTWKSFSETNNLEFLEHMI